MVMGLGRYIKEILRYNREKYTVCKDYNYSCGVAYRRFIHTAKSLAGPRLQWLKCSGRPVINILFKNLSTCFHLLNSSENSIKTLNYTYQGQSSLTGSGSRVGIGIGNFDLGRDQDLKIFRGKNYYVKYQK
jgi:hypothetical protein